MAEVDERPRHAGRASEDGEDEEPGDEEDEDVGGPHPRVHEPFGVLVQIRRRHRLRVQLRHPCRSSRSASRPRRPKRGGGLGLAGGGGIYRACVGWRAAGLVRAGDGEGSFKDGGEKQIVRLAVTDEARRADREEGDAAGWRRRWVYRRGRQRSGQIRWTEAEVGLLLGRIFLTGWPNCGLCSCFLREIFCALLLLQFFWGVLFWIVNTDTQSSHYNTASARFRLKYSGVCSNTSRQEPTCAIC
jgi:hypothetical protein